MLLLLEVALQVRAELLSGRSVFDHLTGDTRFARDERTGLILLRPDRIFADPVVEIRSNGLGLRSPEIPAARTAGSLRIAVIGASTVMGIVAPTNEHTFTSRLEGMLRAAYPRRTIEVINAGMAGYTLHDERLMLERLVLPLRPDLVIAYTGVNDFQKYCAATPLHGNPRTGGRREGLPVISMPGWLLTVRLIQRKTAPLRASPRLPEAVRDPYSVDLGPYRAGLEALAKTVIDAQTRLALVTNIRAYRPEQALEEQERLAATELRQTPCFDVAGLNALYALHNAAIRDIGGRMRIPVLPLDERVPGGDRYFVDSTHLSEHGEQLVAQEIFRFLMAGNLIDF